MADGDHVLVPVLGGKAFERGTDTVDDLGQRLAAGRALVASERPESVLWQAQARWQFGVGQTLPLAEALFDQAGFDLRLSVRITGGENRLGGAPGAGKRGDYPGGGPRQARSQGAIHWRLLEEAGLAEGNVHHAIQHSASVLIDDGVADQPEAGLGQFRDPSSRAPSPSP